MCSQGDKQWVKNSGVESKNVCLKTSPQMKCKSTLDLEFLFFNLQSVSTNLDTCGILALRTTFVSDNAWQWMLNICLMCEHLKHFCKSQHCLLQNDCNLAISLDSINLVTSRTAAKEGYVISNRWKLPHPSSYWSAGKTLSRIPLSFHIPHHPLLPPRTYTGTQCISIEKKDILFPRDVNVIIYQVVHIDGR